MENITLRGRFGICLSSNVCRFGCCLGELEVIQALLFLSSLLEIGGFITMNSWLLYCHDWNEMGTWRTLSWKMIIMRWLRLVIIAYLVSCCQMSLVLYGNCELFGVKVSFWLLEFIPPGAVGLWARTEIFIPLKLFHDNILICNWKPKQKKKNLVPWTMLLLITKQGKRNVLFSLKKTWSESLEFAFAYWSWSARCLSSLGACWIAAPNTWRGRQALG